MRCPGTSSAAAREWTVPGLRAGVLSPSLDHSIVSGFTAG